MIQKIIFYVVKIINKLLYPLGFQLLRHIPVIGQYISAKETIEAAARNNQTVSDYVESLWGPGLAQQVIDNFAQFGALTSNTHHICEIGTGTGWYAEKILNNYAISTYESYELDKDWAEWLARTYNILSHPADGENLRSTASRSIDLIHANGIFVYTKFLVTYAYFLEIFRVTKQGGFVVFDIFSEECLDEQIIRAWLLSPHRYPSILSKEYVTTLFATKGFRYIGEFFNKFGPGSSLYLVFEKM